MCGHVRAFLRIRKWEFWIEINLTNHSLGEQKIIHFLSATKSSFFAILLMEGNSAHKNQNQYDDSEGFNIQLSEQEGV